MGRIQRGVDPRPCCFARPGARIDAAENAFFGYKSPVGTATSSDSGDRLAPIDRSRLRHSGRNHEQRHINACVSTQG